MEIMRQVQVFEFSRIFSIKEQDEILNSMDNWVSYYPFRLHRNEKRDSLTQEQHDKIMQILYNNGLIYTDENKMDENFYVLFHIEIL